MVRSYVNGMILLLATLIYVICNRIALHRETLLSYIKKITIHFLCPHTHNCIPGSFYFECPLSAKASHALLKLIVLHFQGLCLTFLLPPFYDSVRPSCLQKSPCHGVSTATNTSTYFLFSTNVRLHYSWEK